MTLTEQRFLEALQVALRGGSVDWAEPFPAEEWDALITLAAAHKVLPLICDAVYACPAARECADMGTYKRQAIGQVTVQTVRTGEFLTLFHGMREAGLHPLVVKGILCRRLYLKGDHRPSADEDLLVPDTEFAAACRFLRERSMVPTSAEDPVAFEIGWRMPGSTLYIELHRHLFDPTAGAYGHLDCFFQDTADRAVTYSVNGDKVYGPAPQEHLLYLLLHAYKHFIHSGFGMRQVCDIGLWAQRYADQVDWQALYDQCIQARALRFAAAVFGIARNYLNLPLTLSPEWDGVNVECEPMLGDLLVAGVYGNGDKSRLHSSTVTLNAVEAQRQQKNSGIARSLFPTRAAMERKYPVLKNKPWLLPALWAKRIVGYGKETLTKTENSRAVETLRVAKERTTLLKLYDII